MDKKTSYRKLLPFIFFNIILITIVLPLNLISCMPQSIQEDEFSTIEAPIVSSYSPTTNKKPIWYWEKVETAIQYRYRLDDNIKWEMQTYCNDLTYCPQVDLDYGYHTLLVQAGRIESGEYVWSETGYFSVKIIPHETNPSEIVVTNDKLP